MSILSRPAKQGGFFTFASKVAAGFTKILAAEADADIDTIYDAWNQGADTINIKDNAVTTAKLNVGAGAFPSSVLAQDGGIGSGNIAPRAISASLLAISATMQSIQSGAATWAFFTNASGQVNLGTSANLTPRGTRVILMGTVAVSLSPVDVEQSTVRFRLLRNLVPVVTWDLLLQDAADLTSVKIPVAFPISWVDLGATPGVPTAYSLTVQCLDAHWLGQASTANPGALIAWEPS